MDITRHNILSNNRDLLLAWTSRTIRARYQQSVLGGLWTIIQPAATVAIFTIIFSYFIHIDTGKVPYAIFSYAALVPWTLFTASITDMVDSLVANMNLVTKIYFPREILPIAAMLARLLDFGIAYGVLFLLMVLFRLPLFPMGWLYLPVILSIQLALSLGIGLAGAALNVFYRDIKHLFALVLQVWLYATPIIYPTTMVPEQLRPYYFINPMAGIIEAYRAVLLYQRLPELNLLISAIISVIVLLIGYWFFKRVENQFADVV